MAGYRLWDTERTESISVEDVRLADEMMYVIALTSTVDAAQEERRQRILGMDYALLEFEDGTTMLVELMDDGQSAPIPFPAPLLTLQYLIVG
jgi:hypothetical protein